MKGKYRQAKVEGALKVWMNRVVDWKMKEEKEVDGCQLRALLRILFNAQSI